MPFEHSIPAPSLRVFLCHASDDKAAVRELYRRLRSDQIRPWLDVEDLLPGQDWRAEIRSAIRATDVVLVCLSTASINKSGYMKNEITQALDLAEQKPDGTVLIIPARLDHCTVPDRLLRWHWVDLFAEDGYQRLMRALRKRAAFVG